MAIAQKKWKHEGNVVLSEFRRDGKKLTSRKASSQVRPTNRVKSYKRGQKPTRQSEEGSNDFIIRRAMRIILMMLETEMLWRGERSRLSDDDLMRLR